MLMKDDRIALHIAAVNVDMSAKNSGKAFKTLILHGAKYDVPDGKGQTVVHVARKCSRWACFELLDEWLAFSGGVSLAIVTGRKFP